MCLTKIRLVFWSACRGGGADFRSLVDQLQLIYPDSSTQDLEEFVTGALEEFAALGLHDLMGRGA